MKDLSKSYKQTLEMERTKIVRKTFNLSMHIPEMFKYLATMELQLFRDTINRDIQEMRIISYELGGLKDYPKGKLNRLRAHAMDAKMTISLYINSDKFKYLKNKHVDLATHKAMETWSKLSNLFEDYFQYIDDLLENAEYSDKIKKLKNMKIPQTAESKNESKRDEFDVDEFLGLKDAKTNKNAGEDDLPFEPN